MSAPADPSASTGRSTRQVLLVMVLVSFGAFTAVALAVDGIVGIFTPSRSTCCRSRSSWT